MDKLIEVIGIKKFFNVKKSSFLKSNLFVKAIDGVNLSIRKNEVVGLVGESGCGKTTLGRVILRIIEPTKGKIFFKGQNITNLKGHYLIEIRKKIMMIYQDPCSSLDPRMTIGKIIGEPLYIQKNYTRKEKERKVKRVLEMVEISPNKYKKFPHEFSLGQRQRIAIARALITNPELIIADEPVSSLDVSIQAQIINLFQDLKKELSISILFITHDLSVVKHISDRIAVMYLGKIVEIATKKDLFENPKHPYTRALIYAIPISDPLMRGDKNIILGDIPSSINPPSGCRFHTRCPYVKDICKIKEPILRDINENKNNHFVACHLF